MAAASALMSAPMSVPLSPAPLYGLFVSNTAPQLVGAGVTVPLATGGSAEYANLDHGASAPALRVVRDAVDALLGVDL